MLPAIDTLNIYNRLKSAGLPEASAKEIAEVFRETIEENLATTTDLKTTESNLTKYIELVRAELRKEIAESKASIIRWVAGMLIAQSALIATLVKLL
jgi:hypothetical protein